MARIRTIKPEFFRHEALYEAEVATGLPLRIAFAGIWTVADREGRFRWRPRVIRLDVMPFDDCDFEAVLNALATHGFVVKYEVAGEVFGHIPKWAKHQHVNQRESGSEIPAPDEDGASMCENIPARAEGKGREKEGEGKRVSERAPTPQKSDKRGTRLPSDWKPSPENIAYAKSRGIPESKIATEVEKFRNYWTTKPGKPGVKLDWDKTWQTWVIHCCEWNDFSATAGANADVVAAVEFIGIEDIRYDPLAERWRGENGGKDPPARDGRGQSGVGYHFRKSWIEDLTIPPALRREVSA